MTTSLSKSTIPAYNTENDYFSPRQVPRVKSEAMQNYMKNRGSLDMTLQNRDHHEPRYQPRVKYDVAETAYIKNRGNLPNLRHFKASPLFIKLKNNHSIRYNEYNFDRLPGPSRRPQRPAYHTLSS